MEDRLPSAGSRTPVSALRNEGNNLLSRSIFCRKKRQFFENKGSKERNYFINQCEFEDRKWICNYANNFYWIWLKIRKIWHICGICKRFLHSTQHWFFCWLNLFCSSLIGAFCGIIRFRCCSSQLSTTFLELIEFVNRIIYPWKTAEIKRIHSLYEQCFLAS